MPRHIETRKIGRVSVHTVKVGDDDPDGYVVAADATGIDDGDVVVVGRTVGVRILTGHTCAVTAETGGFATLDIEGGSWVTVLGGRYAGSYSAASHAAGELCAPLMGARSKPTSTGRARVKGAATKTAARSTAQKTGTRSAARTLAAAGHHAAAFSPAAIEANTKTATRASSSAATRRAAAPRRAVPGVQFSDTNGRG